MFDDVQLHDMVKIYTTGGDFTGNVVSIGKDDSGYGVGVVRLRASNGRCIKIQASAVTAVVEL